MSEQRGMNQRIRNLRRRSVETQPCLSMERARLLTEAYQKWEHQVSVPEMRALAFRHILTHQTIDIGPDELLVGEKGHTLQAAPTFPELCCHTADDMRLMNDRALISFTVSEDDIRLQEEVIIPFWSKRSMREKILTAMEPAWHDAYQAGIFTEFMEQRGPGHTVGSENIFVKGMLDYQADIKQALQSINDLNDPESTQKKEQLRAMLIACEAPIILARRYADLAREKAADEKDAKRRGELLQIAENCEVVPAGRPKTYWQALQLYWFVHIGVTTELNPWDAFSPGRLDQHLYPFYEKDHDRGLLNRDQAKELLECLWVKFNNQPAPPKVGITLKESGTYTDFANINTGGIRPDGQDGVNTVSYLILECMDEMRLLQPSSNVQISRKSPAPFLEKACAIAAQGWGQPAFYNTEAIVQELLNAGKTLEDARKGGSSGCVETGAFGNEAYILTGYFNLPKILELTLYNGYDLYTNKQIGLQLGYAKDFKSFDELFAAYQKQMQYFAKIKMRGSNQIEQLYARYMPVPFLSVLTNDCIAQGKDYHAGGARYNTSYIQGVGIGTITDSLAALKILVYEQQMIVMDELTQAIDADFTGFEQLQRILKTKAPKYGNDDNSADDLMKAVFDLYDKAVSGRPNARGGQYRINMLPTTCHVYFGEVMRASPDGRNAGKPLSEGISPVQGADRLGPTAVLKSAAKMDHLRTGGTLLNQKLSPQIMQNKRGIHAMASLIRTYFSLNGHHIQFNVIDKKTLVEAQKNPGSHEGLIVRVAGYSDYFKNLSLPLQNEIIERTEQKPV